MMILVDRREKPYKRDSEQLIDACRRIGLKAESVELPFGDVAFSGLNPDGSGTSVDIGIERKRLHDMLTCIDDSRLSAHQLVGMRQLYQFRFLLLEGHWRPHDPNGVLMEGDGRAWWPCKPAGRLVMYHKLRRYLFSVQMAGTIILYTRDLFQSAYDIHEVYQYFQKRKHTSQMEIQKPNIPTLNRKPSVTRKWAEALEGVGQVHGQAAESLFKTPLALANSEVLEWLCVPGIGPKIAKSVMDQIEGKRGR